jgi:poly-gamma-glutamate synthesis protein (capsule biosynthesis protein)
MLRVLPCALRVLLVCAAGGLMEIPPLPALPAQQLAPWARTVVAVAGDVLPESSWLGGQDRAHFLDGVRQEFSGADLVFVNLEEPITRSGKVTPYKKPAELADGRDYILRARHRAIPQSLKDAGVGLVGLANNHMLDYTAAGLRDTLRAFAESHLPVVGAGLKPQAEQAFVFEKNGCRVALLAFSDVVPRNSWATEKQLGIASAKDPQNLARAIRRARRQADFVVLMIHWGGQGKHRITPRQRQLAQVAAEAGCDVVVGMHPHVLQGIEYVGRVPVFYSVGNFAFAGSKPGYDECVLVKLIFAARELAAVELVPVEIDPRGAPKVVTEASAAKILDHVDGYCRMFNTQVKEGRLEPGPVRQSLVYDLSEQRGRSRTAKVRRAGPLKSHPARGSGRAPGTGSGAAPGGGTKN